MKKENYTKKREIPNISLVKNTYPLQRPYNPFFYPRQPVRNTTPQQIQIQTTQPIQTQTAPFMQTSQTQTANTLPDLQSNNPLSIETQDALEELYNQYHAEEQKKRTKRRRY